MALRELVLLIDSHVHFHSCFETGRFLEAAHGNVAAAARKLGLPRETMGALLLAESVGQNYFQEFAAGDLAGWPRHWSVRGTGERCSLVLRRDDRPVLLLVAGRQIRTAENLEVLALASSCVFGEGLPIDETIDEVSSSGAISVLPWGCGKWMGERGRKILKILDSSLAEKVFLGDNGGRPAVAPTPRLLQLAQRRGILILPGSDPLPLGWEVRKAGGYGCVVDGSVDLARPAAQLRHRLLTRRGQPLPYGRPETLARFVCSQLALRVLRQRTN